MILVLSIHLECKGMTVGIRSASREVLNMVIATSTSMTIVLNSIAVTVSTCIKLGRRRMLMTGFHRLSEVGCLMNPLTWNV